MKGVIVQIGEPKSIVLFNNGKIGAINTPLNCHVGMVVTVKQNNLLKIFVIIFAAALLIALGVFIGARYWGAQENMPPADMPRRGPPGRHWQMENYRDREGEFDMPRRGPGRRGQVMERHRYREELPPDRNGQIMEEE